MSLKAFHVVFVALSTALAVTVGVWAARHATHGGGGGYWALAVGSVAAGVALIVYGVWFLRKTKDVGFL